MKLKYIWHSYDDVSNHEVEVPDDIVFIHNENDIGTLRHDGFGHYLGCSKTVVEDFKGNCGVRFYQDFPGLSLFAFYNVVFESEIKVIPWEDFFNRFDIGSYYVFTYTRDKAVPIHDSINPEGFSFKMLPGRLVSVSKILKMESQNLIDLMECMVSSWVESNDQTVRSINLIHNVELSKLCNSFHNELKLRKNCDKEFTKVLNQVLDPIGKEVINKKV